MQAFVCYLKRQSPPPQQPSFGHGWIMGKDGKYWHPCHAQNELLAELSTTKQDKSWLSKALRRLFH